MTTLAAEFLKQDRPIVLDNKSKTLNALQVWTHGFVRDRLKAPLPSDNLILKADQCAERYVFEEDAPTITRSLVKSGAISEKLVWESMRLPATNFWIEYPLKDQKETDLIRVGLMVGQVPKVENVLTDFRIMMAIVAQTDDKVRVVGLLTLPEARLQPGFSHIKLHWFLDHLAKDGQILEDHDADVKLFVYDLVDCLFLINTPRVAEKRLSSFGPRKLKRQTSTGLPLVEYRRIIMKVGVGTPQYSRGNGANQSGEASARRLHRVVGHFRTYQEGRTQPHISFVPQHWRGDAALGILLHEREVKR